MITLTNNIAQEAQGGLEGEFAGKSGCLGIRMCACYLSENFATMPQVLAVSQDSPR